MNLDARRLLVSATALFALTVVLSSDTAARPQESASPRRIPREEGDALAFRMCNECHDVKTVTARRRTKAEWEHSIQDMILEGAGGTAKEFEDVWAYLVQTRGRVLINEATADEIAEVLALSKTAASAIVDHRTTNGKFDGIGSLGKVAGIDIKALETQADAITF